MATAATLIASVDTGYEERPEHRGHTVEVHGWNEDYVLLLIRSDDRVNEAIVSPVQLRELADRATAEAGKW
jgi:hypothetical protein